MSKASSFPYSEAPRCPPASEFHCIYICFFLVSCFAWSDKTFIFFNPLRILTIILVLMAEILIFVDIHISVHVTVRVSTLQNKSNDLNC